MKKFYTLLLLIVALSSYSQVKLSGVVKDSIGQPLELANVIAINQESKALESYGITDAKGKFTLALGKNGKYNVQVTYIGMKTINTVIETKEADITKDFTMAIDNALDAVELTYEMPVTIKGDTIVYNADSFKNGSERKLEDVLENLPGVEITEDGGIEVEGNRVEKITVNGKSVTLPVIIQPGQAKGSFGLSLGYGRTFGLKEEMQVGVNAYPLYVNSNNVQFGVAIEKVAGNHEFACPQVQKTIAGRHDILKVASLKEYKTVDPKDHHHGWNKPAYVSYDHQEVEAKSIDLWEEHNREIGHHFNLSIDLTS